MLSVNKDVSVRELQAPRSGDRHVVRESSRFSGRRFAEWKTASTCTKIRTQWSRNLEAQSVMHPREGRFTVLEEFLERHWPGQKHASLAELFEVGTATLSDWVTGKRFCPMENLAKIVEAAVDADPEVTPIRLSPELAKQAFIKLLLHSELHRAALEISNRSPGWSDERRALAIESLSAAIRDLPPVVSSAGPKGRRTLADFPEAFYPLVVVCGDRREKSDKIHVADLGAMSNSSAELRWLLKLRLPPETEIWGDKIFLREDAQQLRTRFGGKNLLIVGSPACNHLARRLLLRQPPPGWRRGLPFFRFNFDQDTSLKIENKLEKLREATSDQLLGVSEDVARDLRYWARHMFGQGIFDPSGTEKHWIRAMQPDSTLDWGLVTLARNPFCHDETSVSILAAGFHMFGTAKAVERLSNPNSLAEHPLGGVLRIAIPQGRAWAERFDQLQADWDSNSEYQIPTVRAALTSLLSEKDIFPVRATHEEITETLQFLDSLFPPHALVGGRPGKARKNRSNYKNSPPRS